ncbi:MAG: HPr-rel-A system PqqD family peptide chaperone [Candidatus Marinimicrobia bacterium]|nr:HPr-rel-A system PqqD family peptide chaperone [Candidatus Neomarinimicrobiota bacterium]MDD5582709.1 HPr-rel-A system PqqD family peptide chaperone [Candidatus Neomarinimicrobiota bacterium]
MKLKKNIAISETGFVFDPTTGDSYTLNSVGMEILSLLKEGLSREAISTKILEKYDVEKGVLERYLYDFLGQLKQYQLIEEDDEN